MSKATNDECDRLMRLLDVGLDALRNDDPQIAEMALKSALDSANRLPKKSVIELPDRSKEPLP